MLLWLSWGSVKSEVNKTIFNKDSLKLKGDSLVFNKLDLEPGIYKAETFHHDNIELLFKIDGLKNTTGRFNELSVNLIIDSLKNQNLTVTIQANSIFTANTLRDDELKGIDFFNVKQYPLITYQASRFIETDTNYIAEGTLELLGQTNYLKLPITYLGHTIINEKEVYGFEGTFEFDRTKYGMSHEKGIGDAVKITYYVDLIKE